MSKVKIPRNPREKGFGKRPNILSALYVCVCVFMYVCVYTWEGKGSTSELDFCIRTQNTANAMQQ